MPPATWSGRGSAISKSPLKAFVILIKGKAERQRLLLATGSSRLGHKEKKTRAADYILP